MFCHELELSTGQKLQVFHLVAGVVLLDKSLNEAPVHNGRFVLPPLARCVKHNC